MPIKLEVWGDYACFSRPEMKVERVSYDVMTPSAARGLIESIFWHPGIKYVIDKIHVCNPIRYANIRRNEVSKVISSTQIKKVIENGGESFLSTSENITQRSTLLLRNVRYVIEAHFDFYPERGNASDNPAKFQAELTRRISRGACYRQPCFGCREFPAQFKECEEIPECPEELKGTIDLGWMLFDIDYSQKDDYKPKFFRAIMKDGVITVPKENDEGVL